MQFVLLTLCLGVLVAQVDTSVVIGIVSVRTGLVKIAFHVLKRKV